ncbi:site-specific integrase [Paenibacillus apiarius]|uniref:hypothetical protein n=1 Tax=Paenibacillus apiarius TaxID=46240 RepID=UPI00398A8074
MRIGEILGLRWKDVDLSGRKLSVRQAYTKAESGHGLQSVCNQSVDTGKARPPESRKPRRYRHVSGAGEGN